MEGREALAEGIIWLLYLLVQKYEEVPDKGSVGKNEAKKPNLEAFLR